VAEVSDTTWMPLVQLPEKKSILRFKTTGDFIPYEHRKSGFVTGKPG